MRQFLRHDLRFNRGLWCVVNHRISVFNPYPVGAGLLFQKTHQIVVVLALRPIALPFEQAGMVVKRTAPA